MSLLKMSRGVENKRILGCLERLRLKVVHLQAPWRLEAIELRCFKIQMVDAMKVIVSVRRVTTQRRELTEKAGEEKERRGRESTESSMASTQKRENTRQNK